MHFVTENSDYAAPSTSRNNMTESENSVSDENCDIENVHESDMEFECVEENEHCSENEADEVGINENNDDGNDKDSESSSLDASDVSSNEEESDEEANFNDEIKLRQWAITSGIQHCHLDSLLRILKRKYVNLPLSSKTFLKTTSAEYKIDTFKTIDDKIIGEYIYFGIASGLRKCVNKNIHNENVLHLLINCDGLPLYKSSSKQFWPLLVKIYFTPDIYKPFPVAVFSGNQKPNNLQQYLSPFVQEMNLLLREGIEIERRIFEIKIMSFVCDRPARSFIKCIKGHNGYYACERCTIRGERLQNRTVYLSTNCKKRSDTSFRNQKNIEHHIGISPLLSLEPSIDMVKQFVLDFMHLGCLGIFKKMLQDFWLEGNLTTKLGQNDKCQLSQNLIELQSQIPEEFQRTTRSVQDIAKWKGTEYRLFGLYIGPIVLKPILQKKYYKHFLLLHASLRILCSDDVAMKYNRQAKAYLESFVLLTKQYYGAQNVVMNFHSLIHLADDVINIKCSLSNYTAFPFENALGKMKKMLRSGNRPLAQLCRRIHESSCFQTEKVTLPPVVEIIKKQNPVEPSGRIPISKIKYKQAVLSTKKPNNTVYLNDKRIMLIDTMYIPPNRRENDIILTGTIMKIIDSIFTYPYNSTKLNMWQVAVTESKMECSLQSVVYKMVHIKINVDNTNEDSEDNSEDSDNNSGSARSFVMPLLHM